MNFSFLVHGFCNYPGVRFDSETRFFSLEDSLLWNKTVTAFSKKMIAKWIFFLISLVLAFSHLPSSIPPIFAIFNEKIAAGDINALQSILYTNRILFKSPFIKSFRNGGFLLAVQEDRAPVVEFLLKNANIDAAVRNNEAIRLASANGNYDIVKLLLAIPTVNPGAMKNKALIDATRNGHIEIVRLLLSHPKVDPTIGGGRAVILASSRNHADIIKLFINDGRAIPSIFHIYTLERAAQYGNIDLVRFLLGYPSFSQNVHQIAITGDLLSIRTFVEAGYKFDQDTLHMIIRRAISKGNHAIVEYIESLKEPPKLFDRPLIAMTEQCAICLADDNLLEGIMTFCNHQFHAECLQQWIARHNSCPMCRSSIK